MIDCGNSEIRETLPDLLHDSLVAADRQRVLAHIGACDACRAEYDLLRSVYALGDSAAKVDVQAIAAAIPAYRRRRFAANMPLMRIAAGLAIIAVGGLSYNAVNDTVNSGATRGGESAVAVLGGDSAMPAGSSVGDPLTAALDLNALDDESVADLLSALDNLSSSIPTEPRRLVKNPSGSGN